MDEPRFTFQEIIKVLYSVWYQSVGRDYESKISDPYLVYPQLKTGFEVYVKKVRKE